MKRVGLLAYSSAASTMGLEIVADSIRDKYPDWDIQTVDETTAKDADYLLVSLYWWKDVYEHVGFLNRIGLDPRKRKPVIILGGMACTNPRPLDGYFHYAVIGDGEDVIGPLIDALENDSDPHIIPGVWNSEKCEAAVSAHLPAKFYTEIRTTKVTRIEIARGCRMRCGFCQLAAMKPYRENSYEIIKQLVMLAPTKTIALFAPDRASHSRFSDIEDMLGKYGKRNSGSDIRLTSIKKWKVANTVRFGVEAFTADGRRSLGKPMSDDNLIRHLRYISEGLHTVKGKPISSATCYMIGDLPHDGSPKDFFDVLHEWDKTLNRQFTLFLSVSSFTPSPFTPMERAPLQPYSGFNKKFMALRPHYKNIVIASRGAVIGPGPRLSQMLTIRGDERCRRALFHLATKERKLTRNTGKEAGKRVEAIIKASGYDPTRLYAEWPATDPMPWSHIIRPWIPHPPPTP